MARGGARCALLVAFCAAALHLADAQTCASGCSGHGTCVGDASLRCSCFEGWRGPSCAERLCPTGRAWLGYGLGGTDDVHDVDAECSGVGFCNRVTGACRCQNGFLGSTCERLACPGTPRCSGHGRCMTLRDASRGYDGFSLVREPASYDLWDADRVQGCACDAGWTGHDCGLLECPAGDDPLTPGVPEVQTLSCACPASGACGSGYFSVSYAGRTRGVLWNAVATTAEESAAAARGSGYATGESVESVLRTLRDLPFLAGVEYSATAGSAGGGGRPGACDAGNSIRVTFLHSMGDAPLMTVGSSTLRDAAPAGGTGGGASPLVLLRETVKGTTERVECSRRGLCDSARGTCACYPGFYSSDGMGGPGTLGDCGSLLPPGVPDALPSNITACPGTRVPCNGRGWCDTTDGRFVCQCYAGWAGGACDQRTCPLGRAWFDEAVETDSAHSFAECSRMGRCDRTTGVAGGRCTCATGFAGAACDRLACATDDPNTICSGHGRCMPIAGLVTVGTRSGEKTGAPAVQALTCSLASGGFTLTASYAGTPFIPFDASPAELRRALELLPSVGFLNLRTTPGTTGRICDAAAPVTTRITFTSDGGEVPALTLYTPPGSLAFMEPGSADITVEAPGSLPSYGLDRYNAATWDAEMLHGCHCDGYPEGNSTGTGPGGGDIGAWYGHACTLRACPTGIDPLAALFRGDAIPDSLPEALVGVDGVLINGGVPAGSLPVPEVQQLACQAGAGSFTLRFRWATTQPIPFSATAAELQTALQALPSIGRVEVTLLQGDGSAGVPEPDPASPICRGVSPPSLTRISFTTELGGLPLLAVDDWAMVSPFTLAVTEAQAGTGVPQACAGRGTCDAATGLCRCFPGWSSSDGRGRPGNRGDCGYYDAGFAFRNRK